ncbi:MAG: sulfite exporter TauE/SafE family protein [Oligoflexia bacterium]|nr:sulfite exporter TauE/SafE family protein [Oligoflexia bacterium]
MLLAFGAGFLSSLNPCVYPLIPLIIGFFGREESKQQRIQIGVYVIGQVLTLTTLGVVAVSIGETFGFTSESKAINLFLAVFLISMAVYSWLGKMPGIVNKFNHKFSNLGSGHSNRYIEALLLGVGSALVTSPCSTPMLSSVLTLMATSQTLLKGTAMMFFYSLGFSTFLALISLGVLNLKKLPKAGKWMNIVHKFSAVLLFLIGLHFIGKTFKIFDF